MSAPTGGVCTATIKSYEGHVFNCAQPAGHYDEGRQPQPLVDDDPGGWHRSAPDREGCPMTWSDWASGATPHGADPAGADATVCTPIPVATLTQLSEVPPELLAEEQLGRAENALERLRLAREALIRDGYFTADEVGPDIAPRIVEWLSHHRRLAEELNAELARLRAGEEPGWDPMVVPTPGQWIARWNSLDPVQRLARAQAVIETAETANRCHFEGHALKLEEGRENWLKLNGGREEVARWKLNTLEPQTARALDDIGRALREGSDPESLPGFVPAAVPKCIPRTGDPADALVVEPYRNDQNQDRWVFRCWGTDACDGWLSLDHASQQWAEQARDRHVAEAHTTEEQVMPSPKRIIIEAPDGATVLAARHLDATEGPVRIGSTVDAATRSAITTVLRYIAKAHNSPAAPADGRHEGAERVRALHVRNPHSGTCEHCSAGDYPDYAVRSPCPTIRALDGEEQ